jgi:hypothetical protein
MAEREMADSVTSPSDPHGNHPGEGDNILIGSLGDSVLHGGHEMLTFLHGGSYGQNTVSGLQQDLALGAHSINQHDLTSSNLRTGVGSVPGPDQPSQVPIGTPIAFDLIGSALLFLPELLGVAGR